MLSRTWALWGKSRTIGLILVTAWVCTLAAAAATVKSGLMVHPFRSTRINVSNALVVYSRRYSIGTDGGPPL
jgi:hypothetical protein